MSERKAKYHASGGQAERTLPVTDGSASPVRLSEEDLANLNAGITVQVGCLIIAPPTRVEYAPMEQSEREREYHGFVSAVAERLLKAMVSPPEAIADDPELSDKWETLSPLHRMETPTVVRFSVTDHKPVESPGCSAFKVAIHSQTSTVRYAQGQFCVSEDGKHWDLWSREEVLARYPSSSYYSAEAWDAIRGEGRNAAARP